LSLIRMDLFIATFKRLINLDFSRLLSFYTTINMLFSSFESIIIGVPNIKVLNTYTSLNTVVSDNSFGLYLLSYGLIFTFFYLIVVVILLNKFKISLFYWIYFLVILLFNNAILWDVWILYFLTLINTINDLKKGDTYNENKEIFNFSNRRWETNKEKIYSLRHSLY
jgi:cellulose synthase/poly-beta-1,6-N-acetylglucosamine synthase-like glycosyltransferase